MIFQRKQEEAINHDNVLIGYYEDMAIIQTEDGELHFVDEIGTEFGQIGDVVEDDSFSTIKILPQSQQKEIIEYFQRGPRLIRIYDAVILSSPDTEALYFGQFLDDFYRSEDRYSLISEEPPYDANKQLFLCKMAATAHKLANDYNLSVPAWVSKDIYIYEGVYYSFGSGNLEIQNFLEETTPDEFKQRNLFVGDSALKRC